MLRKSPEHRPTVSSCAIFMAVFDHVKGFLVGKENIKEIIEDNESTS